MPPVTRIPLLDPRPEMEALWGEIAAAVESVLRSGRFILGPAVLAFEREAAEYLGCAHAVGVNSGTDALVIALRSLGIGPGDEVITTPFTFFATAEAISNVGARPVFADIEPDTFNIDPVAVKRCVSEKTRAILPVHLFGLPCRMDELRRIAGDHGLVVIEDAAQAFGAAYGGQKVGTLGDAAAFSFFPSKPLAACGDAGLLTTDNDDVAREARKLRAHGATRKYFNEAIGYNSRLDELQAAILRVKLPRVARANAGRRSVAERYTALMEGVSGLSLPAHPVGDEFVVHQYTVRVLEGRREELRASLDEAGVDTMVYYPFPLHQLPPYSDGAATLPYAEQASREVLSLPLWPGMPPEHVDYIVGAIVEALG